MNHTQSRIAILEEEIRSLPAGYISKKNINGKIRQYYQWNEDGKKRSKYLDDATAAELSALIQRRRNLQSELKECRAALPSKTNGYHTKAAYGFLKENSGLERYLTGSGEGEFRTNILLGDALERYVIPVRGLQRRECYTELENYLREGASAVSGKVFILYGLRRTGKTTLIRQAIDAMTPEEAAVTAVIQVRPGNTLGDLNFDLRKLESRGYRYVFLDEVTLAEDFIEGAALLSDIYAASGMKIVLSGTDSLGFLFTQSEELYDRSILLHTTWIPYREFEHVLGIRGIDEYIRYGGTMSLGGTYYNEASTFTSKESADEYVDSAIARNIQHSLKHYQYGGHFRHLEELYDRNELTSAINRVVEDINHRFTIRVLTDDFVSHDLGISAGNLRKDRVHPLDVLDRIDRKAFTEGLKKALEILNRDEQSVGISDAHRIEIKEYLDLLDLTVEIPTEFLPVGNERVSRTVIAQPGLRYAQAESLVRQLMLDEIFQNISAADRAMVIDRIMSEIRGRMMEELILLETRMAYPKKEVFRLQFRIGEFDMVVADPTDISCEIYEIKHSVKAVPEQYHFLADEELCGMTEFRFGRITRKAVIYRGDARADGIVEYLNVEEYLKQLP